MAEAGQQALAITNAHPTTKTRDKTSRSEQQLREVFKTPWDWFRNSWCPEGLALTLSVACAVATFIILRCYGGKPNPRLWLGLTLNALISILATTSKVSLIYVVSTSLGQLKWTWFLGHKYRSLLDAEVFDDASRGPLGSLIMLCHPMRTSVAIFGAILTLVAVTYDPFVQQVIQFQAVLQSRPAPGDSVVISKAQMFNTITHPRPQLDAAVWTDSFDLEPSCASRNCAWPTFQSLAWRSQCFQDRNWTLNSQCNLETAMKQDRNVSAGVSRILNCSLSTQNPFYQRSSYARNVNLGISYTMLNKSTLNNDTRKSITISQLTVRPLYSMFASPTPPNWTSDWISGPIFTIGTFNLGFQDDLSTTLNVTTCELDIVVNEYHVEVDEGRTNITITSSQPLQKRRGIASIPGQPPAAALTLSSFVHLRPEPSSNITLFDGLNMTTSRAPPRMSSDLSLDCDKFCRQSMAFNAWTSSLADYLNIRGNLSIGGSLAQNNRSSILDPYTKDYLSRNNSYLYYDDEKAFVWAHKGPYRVMKNVAAAMTRLTMDPTLNWNGTIPIHGYTVFPVTIVRISWIWLIVPYGLCAASALFLIATISVSRQAGAPLWKSSINAFFYHGVDIENGASRSLGTISEMDSQAEATMVRLVPTGLHERLILERQG